MEKKFQLTMKFTFLLVLLGVFSSYATGSYAQDENVGDGSKCNNRRDYFNNRRAIGFCILYNSEDLENSNKQSIDLSDGDIYEILSIISWRTPL